MKFLVIRFSSIGDIVLTTPAIRCLKQQVANAEVHFLTKENFKTVTEGNPYIDKFFYFKDDLPTLIKALQLENYDYIIDLHHNFRTQRIKWALNVKALTYQKERVTKFLLTTFHINKMLGRHIVLVLLTIPKSYQFINYKNSVKSYNTPSYLLGVKKIVKQQQKLQLQILYAYTMLVVNTTCTNLLTLYENLNW
jgi:ADP-heptose:LPS heptosyltransferase